MDNIWERQEFDTEASFNAFHKYYLSQEPPRSVDEAYRRWYANRHGAGTEQGRIAPGIWRGWAWPKDNPSWGNRAQAFDDHLAALQRAKWEAEHMNEAEVLARLAQQARGSLGDFKGVMTLDDLEGHPFAHLVKRVRVRTSETKDGKINYSFNIELHDAQSALVHLGRHHGLFTDKVEHTWRDKVPEGYDPDEVQRQFVEMMRQAQADANSDD